MADTIATSTLTPKANTDGKTVPVRQFKITDIPDAMRKMNWPVAAALMDHWFEGKPWPTEDGAMELAVKGHKKNAPAEYINETIIRMDWLCQFKAANDAISYLRSVWDSPGARSAMRDRMEANFGTSPADKVRIDFKNSGAAAEAFKHFNTFLVQFDPAGGEVNELRGALGDFNMRVIAEGEVTITASEYIFYPERIGFYVDDSYEFVDARFVPSQVLGFWSFSGLAPSALDAFVTNERVAMLSNDLRKDSLFNGGRHSAQEYRDILKDRYYLIQNKSFSEYRAMYKRGGDFKVNSDIKYESVSVPPIVLNR